MVDGDINREPEPLYEYGTFGMGKGEKFVNTTSAIDPPP